MRILDQQRYWAYLKAYLICFTALVGLYVIIDAFSNFDEFTQRASGVIPIAKVMGRYYLVHMSDFYDRLCGVIGMMAAIFTVTWMQKNNELLAMLAAGISTQRVIRPVIISAVLVSGVAVANQEWIMPDLGEELMKPHADDGLIQVKVAIRYDTNGVMMHGDSADRGSRTITDFYATVPVEVYGEIYELQALQARYIPPGDSSSPMRGGWLLRGVTPLNKPLPADDLPNERRLLVKLSDLRGFPPPRGEIKDQGMDSYFLHTSLSFRSLTRRRQWYQYATTTDLIRGLSDPANDSEKMDIAVFLHGRILRPCLALSLLFLTLPQVLGGYARNMFVNLGISLGTAGVFYGLNFISQYLGSHAVIAPEMAAWGPLIGFGTIAVLRWDAIRT